MVYDVRGLAESANEQLLQRRRTLPPSSSCPARAAGLPCFSLDAELAHVVSICSWSKPAAGIEIAAAWVARFLAPTLRQRSKRGRRPREPASQRPDRLGASKRSSHASGGSWGRAARGARRSGRLSRRFHARRSGAHCRRSVANTVARADKALVGGAPKGVRLARTGAQLHWPGCAVAIPVAPSPPVSHVFLALLLQVFDEGTAIRIAADALLRVELPTCSRLERSIDSRGLPDRGMAAPMIALLHRASTRRPWRRPNARRSARGRGHNDARPWYACNGGRAASPAQARHRQARACRSAGIGPRRREPGPHRPVSRLLRGACLSARRSRRGGMPGRRSHDPWGFERQQRSSHAGA